MLSQGSGTDPRIAHVTGHETTAAPAPHTVAGVPAWRIEDSGTTALFLGRGAPRRDGAWAPELLPAGVARAWLHQVHSNRVVEAAPGACGEADALVTTRPGLAAIVATADCVPVLLASPAAIAAVHAGWRGVTAGVIAATVERLARHGGAREMAAWIGPAIGPCCYEVGPEVARRVAEAGGAECVREGPRGRPHADLALAVARQLAAAGVGRLVAVPWCTRCHPEWLWSHRRDGEAAGRNLALIWRAARPISPG